MTDAALRRSLAMLAGVLEAEARDPWWIIGSAGLWLSGVDPGGIADIDLIVSAEDGARLLDHWQLDHRADDHPQFRSATYARWTAPPVPIELMASFRLREEGKWVAIEPQTRIAHDVAGACLYTPSLAEQAALLRRFGRKKDLDRLARIAAAEGQ
ncbi:hypothetical protein [Sphingomicrobium arenosum]|uniref:hypothetical protein n=1 Tax=Sphingomicrobium arenosum TaxID=2233861 RepID=UPI0022409546|nr:hypothetical protein [Sphingomicrobium arenosum]